MKIEIDVPDGEYCLECPYQERFEVEEFNCTVVGDLYFRYVRFIVANCRMFNQQIRGMELGKMDKCVSCSKAEDK